MNVFSKTESKIQINGVEVAQNFRGLAVEYKDTQERACTVHLAHWSFIQIKGTDSEDYLQRMSSIKMPDLKLGEIRWCLFLTPKARIVDAGLISRQEDDTFLFSTERSPTPICEHLEKYQFAEDMTVEKATLQLYGAWNLNKEQQESFRTQGALVDSDPKMPHFSWLFAKQNQGIDSLPPIGLRCFDLLRTRAGLISPLRELNDDDLALEVGLDCAISRNKGCYPGQEVVERILSRGQVNRKVLPVKLKSGRAPKVGESLNLDDRVVGKIVSWVDSASEEIISSGLAILKKEAWENETLHSSEGTVSPIVETTT